MHDVVTPSGWFRFEISIGSLPCGAAVVDAADRADLLWEGPILSLLEDFSKYRPIEQPTVVFLGDGSQHQLADVLAGLGVSQSRKLDPSKQRPRGPVIGPYLYRAGDGPIGLIAAGPVLDFADWDTPRWRRQIQVFRLAGDDRISPVGFTEWGPGDDTQPFLDHLRGSVTQVTVGGSGGAVVGWVGAGWQWEEGSLVIAGPPAATWVRFAHPDGSPPRVVAVRSGGSAVDIPVVPTEPPPVESISLSPAECSVLTLWSRGQGFVCPACRTSHSPGQARCPGPATGTLLPSLRAGELYAVTGQLVGWGAVPIGCRMAVLADGRLARWPGDDPRGRLIVDPTTAVPSLAELYDGGYAVLG